MLALKAIVQPNDQIASNWNTKCVCKSQVYNSQNIVCTQNIVQCYHSMESI